MLAWSEAENYLYFEGIPIALCLKIKPSLWNQDNIIWIMCEIQFKHNLFTFMEISLLELVHPLNRIFFPKIQLWSPAMMLYQYAENSYTNTTKILSSYSNLQCIIVNQQLVIMNCRNSLFVHAMNWIKDFTLIYMLFLYEMIFHETYFSPFFFIMLFHLNIYLKCWISGD